ncbi:MAG: hypothetical protein K8I30_11455 [Anaerolineae bacterium]|nr:hypothetical protein [Anaerolineae bacterium]
MAHETLILEIDDQPADDLYPSLNSLEVEMDEELAGMFRLRLGMTNLPDGTWQFLDDDRFVVWNKVVIKAGFDDSTDAVMTGYITQVQPPFAPELADCAIEIWGMDGSV